MYATIPITERHIAGANRLRRERPRPYACPVALALSDATGRGGWWVGSAGFHAFPAREPEERLPRQVRRFIRRFDAGRPVALIVFRTYVPGR